jgi:hypothetical protein
MRACLGNARQTQARETDAGTGAEQCSYAGAMRLIATLALLLLLRQPSPAQSAPEPNVVPLPDPKSLLSEVERNEKRMEALQRDYTYHVHTEQQDLTKEGAVKKTETTDAESLTLDGVRVNRIVARNGQPLTPEEQQKESARLDKDVAKAKERRARLEAKGAETDERGEEVMPLSRILELGTFSNPRRVDVNGRPAIVLDYAGNPQAKTHSPFETIMRDVEGTVWVDEADRILVRAEGHFRDDFKLGGGLMADVHKGSHFAFQATRVGEGVWLPGTIDGEGSVRMLLFAHFNGRMHLTASDYRRFRASATIVGSHGVIGEDGVPVPGQQPLVPPSSSRPDSAETPH